MDERSREIPALLGIPFDGQSSYLRGAAEAPAKIREALGCDASNQWTETGVDLGGKRIYGDAGDVAFADAFADKDAFAAIEAGVSALIEQGKR
ncbi:MAG: arginase family protein, partial [Acidobacteriota bacterium]